jgi:prepilin-type processing-associated H-X9-DG protein
VNTTTTTRISGMDEYLLATPAGTRIYSFQSFLSVMLPYIEQANVLAAASGGYSFKRDWDDPANQPATSTRIPTYECPSVPSSSLISSTPSTWSGRQAARGDYWPISRANNNAAVWTGLGMGFPGTDAVNGVLTNAQRTPMLAVTDGLSNTLMVGESGARHEGWAVGRQYADASGLGFFAGAWGQHSNNIVCAGTQGPVTPGTKPAGKVSTAAQLTGALTVNGWNQGELYGFHSGVCNVALGDGSVRSLRDSVSMSVLQRLAARGDGNPVSPDN